MAKSGVGLRGVIMNFSSFFSDFCAALLSGFTLALIFFMFREWWHPLPRLSGQWYLETNIEDSTYGHYQGLRLKYVAMMSQQGSKVIGTMEKLFEENAVESFEYDNEKRIRAELVGYIDRFYLRKNQLSFHVVEHGSARDSSVIFELIEKNDVLIGTFRSTAAGTCGGAVWSKDRHSSAFSQVIRHETIISRHPD